MSGPRRDIQGLKLLGRLGTSVVREIRRILAEDVDPEEKPYNDLVDRARSLGDAGREDRAAVNELRELAGAGGTELLERAAQSFCVQDRSFIDEYDNWDLSYRLLRAAATSGAIEPVSAEHAEFFREVWALESGSPEEGWARLVQVQPALANLEDEIRTGPSGQEPLMIAWRGSSGPWQRMSAIRSWLQELRNPSPRNIWGSCLRTPGPAARHRRVPGTSVIELAGWPGNRFYCP